jgi:succinoglycan biosynthesis transport protein ExoP
MDMGPKKPVSLPAVGATAMTTSRSNDDRVELISFRQKTSLLAESFRTTLTSILFSQRDGKRPKVLVMTSASPKEGKTTVVSNLSITVAEIQKRVLVIDADMRRPRLHQVYGVENTQGLSNLLTEREPLTLGQLEAAVQDTKVPGLFVLASGSSRSHASTLLHSPRLEELVRMARDHFDTVLIDTPPMVNIADARVLARLGDALILIVRSGVTTRDAALLAKTRFAEDGTPILGSILNFWNPATPGYGYYKYYYAGYYHYYGPGSGNHPDDPKGGGGGTRGDEDDMEQDVERRPSPFVAPPPRTAWKPGFAFRRQSVDGSAARQFEPEA